MKNHFVSLLTCSLLWNSPCMAQEGQVGDDGLRAAAQLVGPFADELDCENVGYVQASEVGEHLPSIFNTFDRDQSRSVSRQELLSDPFLTDKRLLGMTFDQMDRNTDGIASVEEFKNYLIDAITQLDGNNDGDVFPREIEHARVSGEVLTPDRVAGE